MDLVQVLPNALKCPCVSIKHALKKQGIKTLKPLISQGFQVSVSILVTQDVIAKHYRYRSKPQFAEKIIGRIYLPTSNL